MAVKVSTLRPSTNKLRRLLSVLIAVFEREEVLSSVRSNIELLRLIAQTIRCFDTWAVKGVEELRKTLLSALGPIEYSRYPLRTSWWGESRLLSAMKNYGKGCDKVEHYLKSVTW